MEDRGCVNGLEERSNLQRNGSMKCFLKLPDPQVMGISRL